MRHAVIMAGGSGTRLWPVSRAGEPKQLIRFIRRDGTADPVSLLEIAAGRLKDVVPPERQAICTGERFRGIIGDRMPGFTGPRLMGEPMPRDTVNAVGFAAAAFMKEDPDAVFAVLTADHLIEPQSEFARAMEVGFRLVEEDASRLVSFGITPTFPATGFGYIEDHAPVSGFGGDDSGLAFEIARFVEKPPLEKAQEYLASGKFFWNAGMFVFKARTFMDMLKKHKPESYEGLRRIGEAWGTDQQKAVIDEVYPELPKISVDYAVMEPAAADPDVSLCGVRMDLSWLDVGSWPAYGETLTADNAGNQVSSAGFHQHDSTGNVVVSMTPDRHVALVGCEDLIVIETKRATLVMPKDRAQDLKKLHAELPDELK